jgi:M penetrans paralogue family 26
MENQPPQPPPQTPPNQENINQQFNQQFGQQFGQQPLPNGSAVLVLGIISIVGCYCVGIVGLICGIIALVLATKANKLLLANPAAYSQGSIKNLKAGRVCAIIGTSLSAVYFIFWIIYFLILGAAFSMMPWGRF